MTDTENLNRRLDTLCKHVDKACKDLEFKGKLRDGHLLSSNELKARYKVLKADVDGEIASLEARGHHVGALEQDVMAWMKRLDLRIST